MSYTLHFIFDCKIGIERELEPTIRPLRNHRRRRMTHPWFSTIFASLITRQIFCATSFDQISCITRIYSTRPIFDIFVIKQIKNYSNDMSVTVSIGLNSILIRRNHPLLYLNIFSNQESIGLVIAFKGRGRAEFQVGRNIESPSVHEKSRGQWPRFAEIGHVHSHVSHSASVPLSYACIKPERINASVRAYPAHCS